MLEMNMSFLYFTENKYESYYEIIRLLHNFNATIIFVQKYITTIVLCKLVILEIIIKII